MDASRRGDNRTQEGVTLKTARGDIDGVGEDEVTVTPAAYKDNSGRVQGDREMIRFRPGVGAN